MKEIIRGQPALPQIRARLAVVTSKRYFCLIQFKA